MKVTGVVKTYRNGSAVFEALRGWISAPGRASSSPSSGRSGSGKSTLLNLIAGIDRTSGRMEVGGAVLADLNENNLAAWRGRTVGVVFQSFRPLPTLTVAENVMLPMELCRTVPVGRRRSRAIERIIDGRIDSAAADANAEQPS